MADAILQKCVLKTDEDGDDITISSDEEVMTALTSLHGNLMKLDVHVNGGAGDDKDDVCEILIGPIPDTNGKFK